jgi:hypothetical protein
VRRLVSQLFESPRHLLAIERLAVPSLCSFEERDPLALYGPRQDCGRAAVMRSLEGREDRPHIVTVNLDSAEPATEFMMQ